MTKRIVMLAAGAALCGAAWAGSISVQVLDKEGKPAADAVVAVSPTWRAPLPRTTLQGPYSVTQERMQFADGEGFELRLEGKAEGKPAKPTDVPFNKAGPVLLSCHIHGSMRGYVFVTDSPWTAKTNADGQAILDEVPEGVASIRVWHADQLLDLKPLRVEVGSAPVNTTVKLDVVPRRRRF